MSNFSRKKNLFQGTQMQKQLFRFVCRDNIQVLVANLSD